MLPLLVGSTTATTTNNDFEEESYSNLGLTISCFTAIPVSRRVSDGDNDGALKGILRR